MLNMLNLLSLTSASRQPSVRLSRYVHTWHVLCIQEHATRCLMHMLLARGVHTGQARRGFFFVFFLLLTSACLQLKEVWCDISKCCKSGESSSRPFPSQLCSYMRLEAGWLS